MNEQATTYRQILKEATELLEHEQIEDAATDAWLLMEAATGMSRSDFFLNGGEAMLKEQKKTFANMLEKRQSHVPVQYIIGRAWFYGYPFLVSPAVLIPRLDTEILVEQALQRLSPGQSVLDVCTGSGCILLTLMKEMDLKGTGSDLSADALAVAKQNNATLEAGAEFLQSDLFEKITGKYDMIVSNPPYIATAEIETLTPEVKDHEPRMALDGMTDGLYFYRKLIAEAPAYLKEDGWLCMEIGYDQGDACKKLMQEAAFREIEVVKDLAGLDRVVLGRCQTGNKVGENNV